MGGGKATWQQGYRAGCRVRGDAFARREIWTEVRAVERETAKTQKELLIDARFLQEEREELRRL